MPDRGGSRPALLGLDGLVSWHVAIALRNYTAELRRRYQPVPPGLVAVEQWFVQAAVEASGDVRSGQGSSSLDAGGAGGDGGGRITLTRQEAAAVMGISISTLDRIPTGELPRRRIGRRVLIRREDLDRYAQGHDHAA